MCAILTIAAARAHRHRLALALDFEHRALYGHQLSAVARLSMDSFILERQLLELVHVERPEDVHEVVARALPGLHHRKLVYRRTARRISSRKAAQRLT